MSDKHTSLQIEYEQGDEETNQVFGEFDPDEFEILDEVGEDEEITEETKQIHNPDEQSSETNHDYKSMLKTTVNVSDVNKSKNECTTVQSTNKSTIEGDGTSLVFVGFEHSSTVHESSKNDEPTKYTNEYENIKESSREQELLTNSNKPVGKTKFQLFSKSID